MMFELKACIVCFSASGCLEDIDSGNLRALFGSVAGFQPDSCLMKPHYLCTECSHLVKLCYEFRAKCSSANLALKQHMMMKSLQVGTQQISVQNVQVPQVTQHLICLNYDSKDLECEVKLESLATPPYGAPADEHWGDAAKEEHRDETDLHTEDAAPQQAARVSSEVIWQTKQVENYKSETDVGLKTITLSCGVCRNTSKIKGDKNFLKKKKMMVYNFVCEVCLPLVKSDWHTYKKCFGEQNNEHTITNKMLKNFERVKDPKDFLKYSPVSQEEQYRLIQDRQYKRNTNSKFKCPLCYKACTFINSYANHMKKHDPISGNFQCDVCKVYRLSKRKLKEHMEKCHIYKWTCVVEGCSFVCYSRVNAVKHYKYHKDTTFTCKYCGLIFKKETSLFSHLRLKHPERNLLCSLCGFGFVSDFGLRTHRKRVHTKEEIDQLENFVVDPESDLYCEHCKVQFLSGIAYAEHAKSSCKLFFVESEQSNSIKPGESRRYNRRTVSNPKAICEVCGKSVFKGLLKLHIRTHTGEKPFACPHCDRRFNASFNRDRHLRTHTGEKPFMCHHCSRSFSGKNAMKCHIQTVHLKIPYEPWVRSAQKRRLAKLENAMEPSGAI